MTNQYNDNQCISNNLTEETCGKVSDIRPAGANGLATYPGSDDPGGVYGGADGSEQVPQSVIEYLRALPCDRPVDWKAIRTLFHWAFTWLDTLCQRINNIACLFGLTAPNTNETIEGYLAKIKNSNGQCRTGIVAIPEFEIPTAVYITEKFSAGETPIVSHTGMTVPLTQLKINTDTNIFAKSGNTIQVKEAGIYLCIGGASARNRNYSTANETFDVYLEVNDSFPYFAQQGTNMKANDDIDAGNVMALLTLSANDKVNVYFYSEIGGGLLYGSLSILKIA